VTPSTRCATSAPKRFLDAGEGILGVFDGVMEKRGSEGGGIEAHVREDVRDFEQMGQVRLAGAAELVVVALGGNLVGATDHPGIFGRAVSCGAFRGALRGARRAGEPRGRG